MKVDRISYAKILIEMNITKSLPTKLKVEYPNSKDFTQVITYEWVPTYCPAYLIIGHTCVSKDDTYMMSKIRYVKQKIEWQN